MSGSDLSDKECCTDAGMYFDTCLQGQEVLVLLLEYIGNVVISEVVLQCVD